MATNKKRISPRKRDMTNKIPFLVTDVREVETLDFPALEEVAGVQFHEAERQQILDLIKSYLEDSDAQDELPTDAQMKDSLKKIAAAADNLANLLTDSSYKGRAVLFYCWPGKAYNPQQERLFLSELVQYANAAAATISPARGRPKDIAWARFIRELYIIWRFAWRFAGKPQRDGFYRDRSTGAPSGPFFLFLQSILEQSTGEFRTPEALYKAIRKAIKSSV